MTGKMRRQGKRAGRFSQTVPLNPDDILTLRCSGPISIRGRETADAFIKGFGEVSWTREGQQVTFHFDGPITAVIPRNARLRLDMDGPISVKEVSDGDIEVLSMDGPLTLQGAASLRVQDADGPLTISGVRGVVEIRQADGPVTLKQIGGNITIGQGDGPLTARDFQGDLQATMDGCAFLEVSGAFSQRLQLRIEGDVALKMPASAQVAGVIEADGNIIVELEQQRIETSHETITLTRPDGATPLISVAIKADGDVYIGPNPPVTSSTGSGFHFRGLGRFFGRRRGRRTTVSRVITTPPPATAPESEPAPARDDFAVEREMILRMVAEGKLTAEEGNQLLEALE